MALQMGILRKNARARRLASAARPRRRTNAQITKVHRRQETGRIGLVNELFKAHFGPVSNGSAVLRGTR